MLIHWVDIDADNVYIYDIDIVFFPKHIYKILKVVLFDFSGVLQFYRVYIRYHVMW